MKDCHSRRVMKKVLFTGVLFVFSWTICAFACPDPAFYRPATGYLTDRHIVAYVSGKIYVLDEKGWFTVDSLQKDETGTFYTSKFKDNE